MATYLSYLRHSTSTQTHTRKLRSYCSVQALERNLFSNVNRYWRPNNSANVLIMYICTYFFSFNSVSISMRTNFSLFISYLLLSPCFRIIKIIFVSIAAYDRLPKFTMHPVRHSTYHTVFARYAAKQTWLNLVYLHIYHFIIIIILYIPNLPIPTYSAFIAVFNLEVCR